MREPRFGRGSDTLPEVLVVTSWFQFDCPQQSWRTTHPPPLVYRNCTFRRPESTRGYTKPV
uniref:Uncharacterized protein n=1 Tax=Ralstonia solanacearum TaxID=305 RepID=A0A0S4WX30_RALSL|nr:protein of unknown function [Ralstonia solanacearum]